MQPLNAHHVLPSLCSLPGDSPRDSGGASMRSGRNFSVTGCHSSQTTAEVAAAQRDADDLESLDRLFAVVRLTHAQVCRIPAPRHPERRWDVRDLLDALSGAMTDIAAERDRIRNSPVVLEAAEGA